MSEVEARPSFTRGRSSARGGRGGFSRGGPRGGRKPANGTSAEHSAMDDSLEDQGELGEMKKKYALEVTLLKDMFPDWTDVDLVFALQEADGDVPATVDRITQGSVSQFSEVKKPKDRARSKVKDDSAMAGATDRPSARGGRGRGGSDSARGGRGRGSDRARGGSRGGRGGHATANGTTKDATSTSVPTTESSAWDQPATAEETAAGGWDTPAADATKDVSAEAGQGAWGNGVTTDATPAAASEGMKSSLIPEGGAKKSWASMFSLPKPTPAAAPAKQATAPSQPPPAEMEASGDVSAAYEDSIEAEPEPETEPEPALPAVEEAFSDPLPEPSPVAPPTIDHEELVLQPSQDALTEANVEHLPDESNAPATQTVASTIGSMDTRNLTPLPGQKPPPIGLSRPPMGGYATSAYRAAGVPGRSASYQRRVQEQQEAVVMPGHNAVDRAAVQFGSMGLNGEAGSDVDEDREEPETQQALQHSPPSQPRTSLPPAPRQMQETARPEGLPTPKQAPGLPPASQHNQQQMQDAAMASSQTQDPTQMNPAYNQYGHYGQPGVQQQDSGAQQQKPYDPFGQQTQQSPYDQYGTQQGQQQHAQQAQQPSHAGFGGLSSAPNEYQSYYTSNEQQRNAYNQYYGGSYGPQDARSQVAQGSQEAGVGQQRTASGFGASSNESPYNTQAQQQAKEGGDSVGHAHRDSATTMCMLPGARARTPRLSAIHPDMMAEVTAVSRLQAETNMLDFAPLQDLPDVAPDTVLTSPIPVTYLPSPVVYLSPSPSDMYRKQIPSRFGEAPGSGHNTPNPLLGGQHQQQAMPNAASQAQQHSMQQGQSAQQQQPQQGGYGQSAGFPYGHPYYQSPYQQAYAAQHGYNQYQQPSPYGAGSSGGYPSKQQQQQQQQQGGMYASGPGGYGMGAQSSFDQHSASPANAGAFGQNQQGSMRSASGMSSGLGGSGGSGVDDYGRSSVQGSAHQSSAFGGMGDPFARSASGFGGHGGYGQQGMGVGQDDASAGLKPYGDSKAGGPSPGLGQPGRPGSAANSAQGSAAQQAQQSAFGGYPGFPSQGSQYGGGLGGLGGHQQGQQQQQGQSAGMAGGQGGYGAYGGGGFGQTYGGGYGSRGGWGSNYGAH
ncbi:RNAPII degradation factor [Teratosphaeriaceae sp. CCFEE 6253]|nr:RNAPII degradation factor [Teratosphaeriaceae sp. CCFEE 6253]